MGGAHDIAQTEDARGDRFGQQDGADNLGVDDPPWGLSRFGAGASSMIDTLHNLPDVG